jgi:hypothetical protein
MKAQTLCYNIGSPADQIYGREKKWEAIFEMPKNSLEKFCKSFLVMISMTYSKVYYAFPALNWLNFHPRIKN